VSAIESYDVSPDGKRFVMIKFDPVKSPKEISRRAELVRGTEAPRTRQQELIAVPELDAGDNRRHGADNRHESRPV